MLNTLKILLIVFVLQLNIRESRLKVLAAKLGDNVKTLSSNGISNVTPQTQSTYLGEFLKTASPAQETDNENDISDVLEDTGLRTLLVKYDSYGGNTCLLDGIKHAILSWKYPNGTIRTSNAKYTSNRYLDLSYADVSEDIELLNKTRHARRFNLSLQNVQVFSAAYNKLKTAPYKTLYSMKESLKCLSLQGNQFAALTHDVKAVDQYLQDTQSRCEQLFANNTIDLNDQECSKYYNNKRSSHNPDTQDLIYEEHIWKLREHLNQFGTSKKSIAWATFPNLPLLVELDISNCSIEYVNKMAFQNVTNLRKLFLSNNKIMTIDIDAFYYIQRVKYLDMSFINVLNYNYQLSMPTLETMLNMVYGLKIHQTAFKLLPELIYLDLSHSKITRNSAVAFKHLRAKLKYLSLCYTSFPVISKGLFKNIALEGLDLSGNPSVSYNIVDDAFEGIGNTLKFLYFEHSNIRDVGWLKPLINLQVLGLSGNNINSLASDAFQSLVSLQILDLSSNHICNWYQKVFFNNSALRVLNLHSNNINILTLEMLKDFETLEYLSLGDNNFLCHCNLREVVEVAANNNKEANCSHDLLQHAAFNTSSLYLLGKAFSQYMEYQLWRKRFVPQLMESYTNIKDFKRLKNIYKLRFLNKDLRAMQCPSSRPKNLNDTTLKFQLLDYDPRHYWCFNETDKLHVEELVCQSRSFTDLEAELHNAIQIVTIVVGSLLFVFILGFIIYLKRWHIHYYYASLKSAALLSTASKESLDKFHRLSEQNPSVIYDIFISYCQNDRQWLLDELIPNVEKSGDISICLHERDFQIGVAILDNIISCMDRSRSLMLLISSKFLLSHWCQFEMYLAQHRIFEMSKEHLILVFLEDIPRSKRPKTLQYLMNIKTYIKWPSKGDKQPSLEERKMFWKRLRKSLELIGIGTKDSKVQE